MTVYDSILSIILLSTPTLDSFQKGSPTPTPLHAFVQVTATGTQDGQPVSWIRICTPTWHPGIWKDVSLVGGALTVITGVPISKDMVVVDTVPVNPPYFSLDAHGPEILVPGTWPLGDHVEAWLMVDGKRRGHAVPVLTEDGALRGWSSRQVAPLLPLPWATAILEGRLRPPTPSEALGLFEEARRAGEGDQANLTISYGTYAYNYRTGQYGAAVAFEDVRAPTRLAAEIPSTLADSPSDNVTWDPFGRWRPPLVLESTTLAARTVLALEAAAAGDFTPARALLPDMKSGQARDLLLLVTAEGDALREVRTRLVPAFRDPTSDERAFCFRIAQQRPEVSTASCAGVNREVPGYAQQLIEAGHTRIAKDLLVELSRLRPLLLEETILLARLAATEPGGGLIALALLTPELGEAEAVAVCRQIAFDTEAYDTQRCQP